MSPKRERGEEGDLINLSEEDVKKAIKRKTADVSVKSASAVSHILNNDDDSDDNNDDDVYDDEESEDNFDDSIDSSNSTDDSDEITAAGISVDIGIEKSVKEENDNHYALQCVNPSNDSSIDPPSDDAPLNNLEIGPAPQNSLTADKEIFDIYIDWLNKNGFRLSSNLIFKEYRSTGRGVGVRKLADVDDLLFVVPRCKCLSARTCRYASLISAVDWCEGEAAMSLCLALAGELIDSDTSFWKPYLDILPKRLKNVPMFWSDAELLSLTGTDTLRRLGISETKDRCEDLRRTAREEPLAGKFPVDAMTDELLMRAMGLIMAYAFQVNEKEMVMAPMADMLNHVTHRNNARLYFKTDEDLEIEVDDVFPMLAIRPIDGGCEIFNTYGDNLGNSELLRCYGFVDKKNDFNLVTISMKDVMDGIKAAKAYKKRVLDARWNKMNIAGMVSAFVENDELEFENDEYHEIVFELPKLVNILSTPLFGVVFNLICSEEEFLESVGALAEYETPRNSESESEYTEAGDELVARIRRKNRKSARLYRKRATGIEQKVRKAAIYQRPPKKKVSHYYDQFGIYTAYWDRLAKIARRGCGNYVRAVMRNILHSKLMSYGSEITLGDSEKDSLAKKVRNDEMKIIRNAFKSLEVLDGEH